MNVFIRAFLFGWIFLEFQAKTGFSNLQAENVEKGGAMYQVDQNEVREKRGLIKKKPVKKSSLIRDHTKKPGFLQTAKKKVPELFRTIIGLRKKFEAMPLEAGDILKQAHPHKSDFGDSLTSPAQEEYVYHRRDTPIYTLEKIMPLVTPEAAHTHVQSIPREVETKGTNIVFRSGQPPPPFVIKPLEEFIIDFVLREEDEDRFPNSHRNSHRFPRGARDEGMTVPALLEVPLEAAPPAPDAGIPPAPDAGIPPAPDVGTAPAPDVGIPPAPDPGIPPTPDVGIRPVPDVGIPPVPPTPEPPKWVKQRPVVHEHEMHHPNPPNHKGNPPHIQHIPPSPPPPSPRRMFDPQRRYNTILPDKYTKGK